MEGLRFARLENVQHVDVEPECEAAFEAALALLIANGIGVQTERVHLDIEPAPARRAGFIVSEADAAAAHKRAAFRVAGGLLARVSGDAPLRRETLHRSATRRREAQSSGLALHSWSCSIASMSSSRLTAPQRSFSFDDPAPVNQADFTAIANFAGCPAISLPLPVPANERPIGLQLIAAPQRDTMLLSAAAQLELMLKKLSAGGPLRGDVAGSKPRLRAQWPRAGAIECYSRRHPGCPTGGVP